VRLDHKKRNPGRGVATPPRPITQSTRIQIKEYAIAEIDSVRCQTSDVRRKKQKFLLLTSHLSRLTNRFLGGYAEGVTPVPIPNTEVKPLRVDGTAWVAMWESRSPPGILLKRACFLYRRQALFLSSYINPLFSLTHSLHVNSAPHHL
jgi:hypothetical protein